MITVRFFKKWEKILSLSQVYLEGDHFISHLLECFNEPLTLDQGLLPVAKCTREDI